MISREKISCCILFVHFLKKKKKITREVHILSYFKKYKKYVKILKLIYIYSRCSKYSTKIL